MVDFQQQSSQQLVVEYEHMNSWNDRLDLRLNLLQQEYYFIKYEKVMSYIVNMFVFIHFDFLAYTACVIVCSSFNIQYQSTGVGPLSSLGKIRPRRRARTEFIIGYGTFRRTCL